MHRSLINLSRLVFLTLVVLGYGVIPLAQAENVVWQGPTKPITVGLSPDDIAHIEMPESITNIQVENSDYVEILIVEGYQNRAFRMKSTLPKMATRAFLTGASGNTYVMILTTDVPYRAYLTVSNGLEQEETKRKIAKQFGPHDLIRSMTQDENIPGVNRETYVIPNWFRGSGMSFDLAEVWQSPTLTGLVVHVRNDFAEPNEVNLPAITIPRTTEWGTLRFAAMENLRLAPQGEPNDKGVLFLVFIR
jgi:hypothetical protein